MNKLLKLLVGIVALSSGCLVAQKSQLPLEDALQIMLQENQQLELSRLDAQSADVQDNWGQAGLLPTVTAQGSYSYSVNDLTQQLATAGDTSSQPAGPNTIEDAVAESWNASATLNYVLFDGFGRINNLRKLGLQKQLSETQLRFTIENTMLTLFNNYYNTARLFEQLEVDREAISLSLERYKRAEAAFELGSGSRINYLSALVDLRSDSVSFLNTRKDYQQVLRNLNQVLDFPADSSYRVDTSIYISDDPLAYSELKQQAEQSNAALVQAQFTRDIRDREVAVAWSEYYPELSANAGYNYTRQENEGSFLQFSESEGWQAGVSVRWNLFNGYRTATQIQLAKINLEKSEVQIEQAGLQLNTDLANAFTVYKNNRDILAIEKRNLGVAKLNYQRSLEAYKLGQLTNTQLREAQLNYIRSKTRLKNLKYSTRLAEIELLRIAGSLIRTVND